MNDLNLYLKHSTFGSCGVNNYLDRVRNTRKHILIEILSKWFRSTKVHFGQ